MFLSLALFRIQINNGENKTIKTLYNTYIYIVLSKLLWLATKTYLVFLMNGSDLFTCRIIIIIDTTNAQRQTLIRANYLQLD